VKKQVRQALKPFLSERIERPVSFADCLFSLDVRDKCLRLPGITARKIYFTEQQSNMSDSEDGINIWFIEYASRPRIKNETGETRKKFRETPDLRITYEDR
jgi:hypothetical protein